MVWPILISASVTPGAFSAAADIAMAPLASKQPNKIRNTARLFSPSMWPVVLRQWGNAGSSRPQTAGCCAPAASGQAVAPLRSAMKNPLRLMSSPRFEDRTLPHRFGNARSLITARLAAGGRVGFTSRSGPRAEVRFATKSNTRGLRLHMSVSAGRGHHRIFNRRMRAARTYEDADVFRVSFARLPLCERPDIGNFAALVRPGIDRPELVGFAILDHRRVVRTLGE